ncbi:MAG: PspA/IM30 family protein [Gammaproteobacteria bacterium]|jgi:phage shock protein A
MALIRRVSRLFAADMHAVLDQIEEPEIVLRQAIREMEEELARQSQRQKWMRGEIAGASSQAERLAERSRDLDAKLDVCFANQDDALARRLTRRKLETAKLREHTQTRQQALAEQLEELQKLLETNTDQLDCMRQQAAVLAISDSGSGEFADDPLEGIDDDDVEIAFLREKQARAPS